MRLARILIAAAALYALAACSSGGGSNNPSPSPTPALIASGGNGTNGTGGNGGYVHIESHGGAVKVLKSGTVDASFPDPGYTPNFGSDPLTHEIVVSDTTVLADGSDPTAGNLCMVSGGDGSLYIGDGNGTCGDTNDILVSGLTVNAGATLVLVDSNATVNGNGWSGYGTIVLQNDLVINGTVTTNASSGLYIEANVIDVESGGKITTSATTLDTSGGEIYLGYGNYINGNYMTGQIINHGTIESKGLGNGSGGYMYFEPADLVVNYGTIDVSGGDSTVVGSGGGSGGVSGELDVYVDYGNFYSSGIVRVNGGKGAAGGGDNNADYCNWENSWSCNSMYIETALYGNTLRNGDIFISGTWEANGGDGTDGPGGYGGYIFLQTDALGAVTINANMSVKGGDGTGAGSYYGASTYGIDIYQPFDPNSSGLTLPPAAGKISIAGTYDLSGGSGDAGSGSGGYLEVYGNNSNQDVPGADIELDGFASIDLNGGKGASGGSASGQAFEIYTYNTGSYPAGAITNEAAIEARGGTATGAGNLGGAGGYVEMITHGIGDPAEVVTNAGSINVSGGTGDNGGAGYTVNIQAEHITNSGNLTANGGAGTTTGGNGGNITLTSNTLPTTNTGTLSANGGTPGGTAGTKTIDGTVIP